jgi:hypothetical protein
MNIKKKIKSGIQRKIRNPIVNYGTNRIRNPVRNTTAVINAKANRGIRRLKRMRF